MKNKSWKLLQKYADGCKTSKMKNRINLYRLVFGKVININKPIDRSWISN